MFFMIYMRSAGYGEHTMNYESFDDKLELQNFLLENNFFVNGELSNNVMAFESPEPPQFMEITYEPKLVEAEEMEDEE